jgi:hypothetical protein
MTPQYESLRASALGQAAATPQGLALLVHRGMPAWLAAWAQCLPQTAGPALPLRTDRGRAVLPGGEQDLVRVLVSMALAGRREERV